MIRIFSVLDGLADKYPDTPIYFHGPAEYCELIMCGHCRGMNRWGCRYLTTDSSPLHDCKHPRNITPFLRDADVDDLIIDLYCPARRHELETRGAVTRERTALFCEAADVPVATPRFHLNADDIKFAGDNWANSGRRVIGFHMKSAAVIRQCPECLWVDLVIIINWRKDQVMLIGESVGLGLRATMFDCNGLSFGRLAAIISKLPLVICVDSALFHLAGALGVPALGLFGPTNGKIISSIYPTAHYIQAPWVYDCDGICYGFNERGFRGVPCLQGCHNLAAVTCKQVLERVDQILSGKDK